ncbi:MAG TPA: SIR2 family protein [Caldisericia bacterium]|nr:SIR2 family protein [Caldisericia bacterium]HPF49913.1 SIR2 family protein [Caldisericia bacterium]HPI83325.1 SIR2 family protein [Caldisericia bacterium]HPQ92949.1 SIR2 family protein [Caldisericia bacterium]
MGKEDVDNIAQILDVTKGSFVLLLGSGISRSAGIKTGYEITEDMIARLMKKKGLPVEKCFEWFKNEYGIDPSFTDVLEQFSSDPLQRINLIKEYIREGKPSIAHEKIAALCKKRYIKFIITTNFDDLIEQTLKDVKLLPTVISSPEQTKCCPLLDQTNDPIIVKLNGDIATSVLTTQSELAQINPNFITLLENVHHLKKRNLILCGWSASNDKALVDFLVNQFEGSGKKLFWVDPFELKNSSYDLSQQIMAKHIKMSADNFFYQLSKKFPETELDSDKSSTLTPELTVEQSPPGKSHRNVQYHLHFRFFHDCMPDKISWIDVRFDDDDLGSCISNIFKMHNLPSSTNVLFDYGGYGFYGPKSSGIQQIGPKTIRVFNDTDFDSITDNRFRLIFRNVCGFINSTNPGRYRITATINEGNPIFSKPFIIEDTPQFDDTYIPTVSPTNVGLSAKYVIHFKSDFFLQSNFDTITIAFPNGTNVPMVISEKDIIIGTHGFFRKRSSIKNKLIHSGTWVTMTVPFDIKPKRKISIEFTANCDIKNPLTPGLYNIQVKTSRQDGFAVLPRYIISE